MKGQTDHPEWEALAVAARLFLGSELCWAELPCAWVGTRMCHLCDQQLQVLSCNCGRKCGAPTTPKTPRKISEKELN